MAVAAKVTRALDLRSLKLPAGGPKVLRLEVSEYVDHTGEDSLRVWVIVDDAADQRLLTGRWKINLTTAIHDALLARGIDLFPYISVAGESEWRELQAGN